MIKQPSQDKLLIKLNRLEKITNNLWLLALFVILICLAWIFVPLLLVNWLSTKNLPDNAGVIGDMFGSVNALFAGLAFLLLIWSVFQSNKAIKIQQEELSLQRVELKESREVLKDQAESQEKMIEAIAELSRQTQKSSQVTAVANLLQVQAEMVKNSQLNANAEKTHSKIAKEFRNTLSILEQYSEQLGNPE